MARHSSAGTNCTVPTTFDCDHGDLLYVYRDAPDNRLQAIYFDNEGHVIHYDVLTPASSTVVFLSQSAQPGPQFRVSYDLKDGVMSGRFEVRAPGQDSWHAYLQWTGTRLPK